MVQSACTICSSPSHVVYDYPRASRFLHFVQEQVNAAQGFHRQNDSYSNTYNPGWRNHDFSRRQQRGEKKVLSALKSLEAKTQIIDSHTQSIAKLETQITQLATAMSSRDEGKLPKHPIENPRGPILDNGNWFFL
ncbi:hypothetical protein M9H77_06420 [Catharanthus roseus]|uniref:Uncharacterized protein n=1 Tax=Catharanthus roseus TaxID=4058 RepID=A0ACC0BS14_CATRO|nr:hypothetical protein M9H77_06420 [Catharanthus roseus]